MTDDDYDALSQKQLASIKRDMRISLEDAAVRATYKVMAELETEQEPVAVVDVHEFYDNCANFSLLQKLPKGKHTLYTTPPQRTWVGLTDDEVARFAHHELWVKNFIREIEEKLRSKNT